LPAPFEPENDDGVFDSITFVTVRPMSIRHIVRIYGSQVKPVMDEVVVDGTYEPLTTVEETTLAHNGEDQLSDREQPPTKRSVQDDAMQNVKRRKTEAKPQEE
jgi:hypothetical protein